MNGCRNSGWNHCRRHYQKRVEGWADVGWRGQSILQEQSYQGLRVENKQNWVNFKFNSLDFGASKTHVSFFFKEPLNEMQRFAPIL